MNNRLYQHRLCWPLVLAIICFFMVWLGFYVISYPVINEQVHKDLYKGYDKEWRIIISKPTSNETDSLQTLKNINEKLRYIEENQKIISDRQADLINDIRQETNNNIDKLNMFAAFSIGVISIFGIFIPLITQHRNNKDVKESIDHIQTLEKNLAHSQEETFGKISGSIENLKRETKIEVTKETERLKKEYYEIKRDYEQQSKIQDFRAEFMALSLGYDDRILSVHPDRCKQMRNLWIRTTDALMSVIEFSKANTKGKFYERREWLMESFVLTGSFIRRIRVHMEGRERILDKISDNINHLLTDLEYNSESSMYWDIIFQEIDSIMAEIHKIRFE